MNSELKKIVDRIKSAQGQLKSILKDKNGLVEEARRLATRQGKEVEKLIRADAGKVKKFLEKERKEIEKLQAQIPGEIQKLRDFVQMQRTEINSLIKKLKSVRVEIKVEESAAKAKAKKKKTPKKARPATKKKSAK